MDFLNKLIEAIVAYFTHKPVIRDAEVVEEPQPFTLLVTPGQLREIYGCSPELAEKFCLSLNEAMRTYGIVTPLRIAHFLAQIGHESGRLRHTVEIWGPTPAQQRYEGRKDLGNTVPGDGSRFRGRGLIQLTGRANYVRMSKALGKDFVGSPQQLESPVWASLSAADFWFSNGCNALADADDVLALTKRINGGTNGLEDRKALLAKAKQVLGI